MCLVYFEIKAAAYPKREFGLFFLAFPPLYYVQYQEITSHPNPNPYPQSLYSAKFGNFFHPSWSFLTAKFGSCWSFGTKFGRDLNSNFLLLDHEFRKQNPLSSKYLKFWAKIDDVIAKTLHGFSMPSSIRTSIAPLGKSNS